MELQRALQQVIQELPEDRLRELLDFARFIAQSREADDWQAFGRSQFEQVYGSDEPEYSESDVKPEPF
jgi:Protein of unknown function (DUF2281)